MNAFYASVEGCCTMLPNGATFVEVFMLSKLVVPPTEAGSLEAGLLLKSEDVSNIAVPGRGAGVPMFVVSLNGKALLKPAMPVNEEGIPKPATPSKEEGVP